MNSFFVNNKITLLTGANGAGKSLFVEELFQTLPNSSLLPQFDLSIDSDFSPRDAIHSAAIYFNAEPVVQRLIDLFEFEKQLDTQYVNLSGGEKQILKWILFLLHPTEIWLLDEPMTGLDKKRQQTINDLLIDEKKNKKIVLIDHSIINFSDYYHIDIERVGDYVI